MCKLLKPAQIYWQQPRCESGHGTAQPIDNRSIFFNNLPEIKPTIWQAIIQSSLTESLTLHRKWKKFDLILKLVGGNPFQVKN